MGKKKNTRRSRTKYPTLTPGLNSRVRQEYLDYDYIDKLSDEVKQFLDDFNKEYYCASVGRQKDSGKKNKFTKGKKAVKKAQDDNNKRNSDLYGRVRNKVGATKLLNYNDVLNIIENFQSQGINVDSVEDALIEYLDNVKSLDNSGNNSDNNP